MGDKIIKNAQENAFASWIDELNRLRFEELLNKLNQQDINFEEALKELNELKAFIGSPEHILGSEFTKHGEIAEHFQVNISNAKNMIEGFKALYTFDGVGRTAPEDYVMLCDGKRVEIQSKFYNGLYKTLGGGQSSGILKHISDYPEFVKMGGKYEIANEQYEELMSILDKSENTPTLLNKTEIRVLKVVKELEKEHSIDVREDIKPAIAKYDEVQQGKINESIKEEEKLIREKNDEKIREAYDESKASIKEGAKAALIGAGLEGGLAFCLEVRKKLKEGKKLTEFTEQDWKDVGIKTGKETVKGGLRGGTIYALTNFTAMPANVASAYFTAAYGIATECKKLREGKISKDDFIINCETLSLDVSISATSALLGQTIIPIPILGAIIGSVTGDVLYKLWKDCDAKEAAEIIDGYNKEMELLEKQLEAKYYEFLLELKKAFKKFKTIEELAFDENVNKAFENSIRLAIECNVDPNKVIKNNKEREGICQYFR